MSTTPAEVTVIVSHASSTVGPTEEQPQYVYESNIHAQNVLSTLNEQRRLGLLCDMTVIVEGIELQAHKAVLAACSSYFKGIITDPANVSHNIVLELSSISRVGMENILEFAYTSKLTLSRNNIDHVLAAARELDVKNLEYACLNLLKQKLLQETDSTLSQCPEGSSACKNSKISRKVLPKPEEIQPLECKPPTGVEQISCCPSEKQSTVGNISDGKHPSTWKGDCPLLAQLSLNPKPQQTLNLEKSACQSIPNTDFKGQLPIYCTPASEPITYAPANSNQAFLHQYMQRRGFRLPETKQESCSAEPNSAKGVCSNFNSDTDEALSADEDQEKMYKCTLMGGGSMNCSRLKKQLDVVLPFSLDDITKLPRGELQELLSKHPNLNVQQRAYKTEACNIRPGPESGLRHVSLWLAQPSSINAVHEIRRRGKNRIAAQRCRKRKIDCIRALQCELERLHKSHNELMKERRCVREGALQLAGMFQQRYQQVFSEIKAKICRQECPDWKVDQAAPGGSSTQECNIGKPADPIVASMAEYFQNESSCAKDLAERLMKLPCSNLPPFSCPVPSSTEVVVVCDDDSSTGICFKPCSPSMCSTTSYSSLDAQSEQSFATSESPSLNPCEEARPRAVFDHEQSMEVAENKTIDFTDSSPG